MRDVAASRKAADQLRMEMQVPAPASNLARQSHQTTSPMATPEAVVDRGRHPSTPASHSPSRGTSAAKTPASRPSSGPRAKLAKRAKLQMCKLAGQHLARRLQSDSSFHEELWLEFERAKVKPRHQRALALILCCRTSFRGRPATIWTSSHCCTRSSTHARCLPAATRSPSLTAVL